MRLSSRQIETQGGLRSGREEGAARLWCGLFSSTPAFTVRGLRFLLDSGPSTVVSTFPGLELARGKLLWPEAASECN